MYKTRGLLSLFHLISPSPPSVSYFLNLSFSLFRALLSPPLPLFFFSFTFSRPFSFSRERFSRATFNYTLVATPYKLELTLEVLKLYRVISVSGIQYSRIRLCRGSHAHAAQGWQFKLAKYMHAQCVNSVECYQIKLHTEAFCWKVTDRLHFFFCDFA